MPHLISAPSDSGAIPITVESAQAAIRAARDLCELLPNSLDVVEYLSEALAACNRIYAPTAEERDEWALDLYAESIENEREAA